MTEKDLQVHDRKDSVVSQGSVGSGHGSNNSAKESKQSGSKSHKSRRSQGSADAGSAAADAEAAGMRKYGQVVLRAPIKKSAHEIPAERKLEDVGMYIKREIFETKPVGHSTADTEEQKKLALYARSLHDELLETKVKDAGYDRFADQYDPHGDMMIAAGISRVRWDEVRAANDTGTSLSKERFSSKYWGTWRTDVMILEKISAEEEVLEKKEPERHEVLKKQKEKMLRRVRRETPSMLPGTSFSAGQNKHDALLFDGHMLGNRNTPSALMEHSLKEPVPVAFHTPSALLPVDSDPYRFGHGISGGAVAQGPARGPPLKLASANIDFPPVDTAKGDPKMLSFGIAKRLTKIASANESRDDPAAAPLGSGTANPSKLPGNKFGQESRTGGIPDTRRSYPGPGTYDVQGIFDRFELPDYPKIIDDIAKDGADFRVIPSVDLTKVGAFAYGCNRQEHVLYGFCLDGQCHKRIEFERAFLQTKNYKRLGAESKQQLTDLLPGKYSKKKKGKTITKDKEELKPDLDIMNIDSKAAMSRLHKKYADKEQMVDLRREFILSIVPEPNEYIYPLHMAATRADLHAIKKMRLLGLDVNLRQGEKEETPLHLTVRNQHLNALNAIVNEFDGVVDVNIQNSMGDTALHLASRKGFKELVEALCDADANPLLKNKAGLTPLQETRAFPIQQLLRLQEDLFKLRSELTAAEDAVAKEKGKESMLAKMQAGGAVDLGAYLAHVRDLKDKDAGDISAADMIQFPWRSAIVSRGGSAAPSSRGSSTQSHRSKILEMTQGKFDADVDKSRTNTSLFRVARDKTNLKDPKINSYLMGYWADEHEK